MRTKLPPRLVGDTDLDVQITNRGAVKKARNKHWADTLVLQHPTWSNYLPMKPPHLTSPKKICKIHD